MAVIRAVTDLPRLSGKALFAALPVKIKENAEKEAFRKYIAECLRLNLENTAKLSGGKYIEASFSDLISPPKLQEKPGAVTNRIKQALRG